MYVVSAYTPSYSEYAKCLEKSLQLQHITKYKIYPYENSDTWAKNTQIKPYFLLKTMTTYKEPVLWIDADAEVKGSLSYFEKLNPDIDISCYYLNTKHKPNELLSGTVYFGYTETAEYLLKLWYEENASNLKWDQINLDTILNKVYCKKHVFPSDYIVISGTHRTWQQDVKKIIIYHKQASREVRRGKL